MVAQFLGILGTMLRALTPSRYFGRIFPCDINIICEKFNNYRQPGEVAVDLVTPEILSISLEGGVAGSALLLQCQEAKVVVGWLLLRQHLQQLGEGVVDSVILETILIFLAVAVVN